MSQPAVAGDPGTFHLRPRGVPVRSTGTTVTGGAAPPRHTSESAAARCAVSTGRPKLLDQVRDAIRTRHYSYRTEEAYVGWIRRFILFHGKRPRSRWARRSSPGS